MHKNNQLHIAIALVSGSVLSNALFVQPSRAAGLEEIVVTARKVEENVQSIPIAISSYSADSLQQQGALNITSVALHTPNMIYTPSVGNSTALRTTIRGQTQNDIIGTLDASIGTYVDDVIWSRPVGSKMNLADIERVEVLRGPQGTLFGRNTTGGAVQVYTKRPEYRLEGRAGVRVGNYERLDYNVMANAPIVEDKLAFRIAYDAQKRDGWQDNVVLDQKQAQDDVRNVIAKLLFNPTGSLEFLLKVDRVEGDYRGPGAKMTRAIPAPAFGGADAVALFSGGTATSAAYIDDDYEHITEGDSQHTNFQNEGAALTATWEVSDALSIRYIGAYRELDFFTDFDLDGTPFPILGTRTSLSGYHQVSHELQFVGSALDDRVDWTAGLYAFDESGMDGSDTRLPGLSALQYTRGKTDNESQAVFGQATWRVTDELSLTGGLRYSEESKGLVSRNQVRSYASNAFLFCSIPQSLTGAGTLFSQDQCRASFDRDDESLDYAFMANYQFTPDAMVYFKTATGFRSGGQNLRGGAATPAAVNTAATVLTFDSFDPETVEEYEIGFKGDLLDRRLRLNGAYFYTKYDDIQRSTIKPAAGGGTATVVANAASASVQGVELEATVVITDDWQTGLTGGWTDARYDRFDDTDPLTGAPIDRSGEEFVSTPEYNYSLWTSYTLALPVGAATFRLDYNWHDSYTSFAGTQQSGVNSPSAGNLNARVQWDPTESLSLALWGTNLTSEDYRTAGIEFYSNFGYALGNGMEPRMYGIEATYRFSE